MCFHQIEKWSISFLLFYNSLKYKYKHIEMTKKHLITFINIYFNQKPGFKGIVLD